MAEQLFHSVWYLPAENEWRELNVRAFKDSGTLIVRDDSVEFQGRKWRVVITHVRGISLGKQGRDFVNDWVKIEYGDGAAPATAFFADGSWLGWGGILGGTKRIMAAVQHLLVRRAPG